MSQKEPTDAELRKLQGSQRDSGFQKLGDSPQIKALLARVGAAIQAREDRQGPQTFHCPECRDTQFQTWTDDRGVFRSKPCKCTQEQLFPAGADDLDFVRTTLWEIDGDDKTKLRFRERGEPTLWIYPDGRRCAYPPYRELPPIPEPLYRQLYDQAKAAKRQGQPELVKPYRR